MSELRNSPLHPEHQKLGAAFTAFGPWNMPLKYGSELEEHRAVRTSAGVFDLSHMGELWVTGPDAARFLSYSLISDIEAVDIGKAKYSMILAADGGIIDDLIAYRLEDERFLLVPNAGNIAAVWEALNERAQGFDVQLSDDSATLAMIAVQGPDSERFLINQLDDADSAATAQALPYYAATRAKVAGRQAIIARTGYTGEDGFEIIVNNNDASAVWTAFTATEGILPCGLAARDSLRLEAAMPLYGNELSRDITAVEAGMGPAFKKKTTDFVGAAEVRRRLAAGATHTIVALTSDQRRAARAGSGIFVGDTQIGTVTSGQPSPTLGYPIALALIDASAGAVPGTKVDIDIRGKRYPFVVTTPPFYQRRC
ncbi:MAG: glycine cleavage system aminomethyltransferase GcvT [Corynebacterium sp.]|nr:glycine cleavage system aminomethyltransferase GcvT [Corynebacterium sp.]